MKTVDLDKNSQIFSWKLLNFMKIVELDKIVEFHVSWKLLNFTRIVKK